MQDPQGRKSLKVLAAERRAARINNFRAAADGSRFPQRRIPGGVFTGSAAVRAAARARRNQGR